MLKKAFLFVADNNLSMFAEPFLTATEFRKPNFLPLTQKTKADEFLENLKELMQSSSSKHLSDLRSWVSSGHSLSELLNLGFKMTKNEYTYAKKIKIEKKLH